MEDLKQYLRTQLQLPLPGEQAHVEMAPIHRPAVAEARLWKDTRLSAVLVLLYTHEDTLYTSLMVRPDTGGVHSGQVSFPGGKKEKEDPDMIYTALREANEEMNIEQSRVDVIGALSELYIPPSKSLVTPVLGVSDSRPHFIPQPEEVQEIIEAPVFELLDDKNRRTTEIVRSSYLLKGVPAFIYQGHVIWGATAMILNEMRWILRNLRA